MDVIKTKKLKKFGYTTNIYYCGNAGFQKYWTKLEKYFEEHGVMFPFNPACFIHDHSCSQDPNFFKRLKVDFIFLKDMIKILNYKAKLSKRVQEKYYSLLFRALFFYGLVTLLTCFLPIKNLFLYIFKKRK